VVSEIQGVCAEKLQPGLAKLVAAEKAAPNAELLQMVGHLSGLAATLDNLPLNPLEVSSVGVDP
jgi:hypothetical protein